MIHFADCQNIEIEGVRIIDSSRWTLHLAASNDIVVRNVTIRSPANASNGDGIDLDGCSNVLVEDCDIETGDDAICLKSSRTWGLERPCRNIIIRRCRAFSTTHGFCIGHDTQDDFEDIEVSDLTIGGLGEYPVLTGIGLASVDGAAIRRVRLSNIEMNNVVSPFQIRLSSEGKSFRGHSPEAAYHQKIVGSHPPGELRDITLDNIVVHEAVGNSFISGLPMHQLKNIRFSNIRVRLTESVETGRVLADVPESESEYPRNDMWRYLPAYGFYFRHIAGLEFSGVEVTAGRQEKRPAILLKDTNSVRLDNVQARY